MKTAKFWDVLVVREDGEWLGFRAPWKSLRRLATYFSVILILCVFSLTGWLMSRWQVQRLSKHWAEEKLKSAALEAQLNDIKSSPSPLKTSTEETLSSFTLLPSLDAGELKSSTVELDDVSSEYDFVTKDLALKFEVVRAPPHEGAALYYWVALLHGPQGLLSLPPALSGRKGDAVLFHRGQAVDEVKVRRAVTAHFKIESFIEKSESEPMFVTLLLYDNKGSLLLRRRLELAMRRGPQGAEE